MLALPLSLLNAPAIAEGPTPSPASTTAPAATPELTAAWDKAAKSGKPVEVPSKFTETMKVWANPDGKHMRAEIYTRPVQLKNPAGAWERIDTRIVTEDGKLRAARVKTPLTFGGRGARQLVAATGRQGTSGLNVTRPLPEPKISGGTITYPDAVAPGADLVVQAQADGFVSQVVFRHRPAAAVTVRLPLTLPEGTRFGKTADGLPQLKDAKGEAKAAPIVLTAMDAKLEASPEEGKSSPVTARVETTGKTSELVFTPDQKFLADPAVTYPVTIAAASEWFGGGVPTDAWVSKNSPSTNNAAAGWLRAGTTSTSADVARVYLKFNTDDPALQGATVVDADLWVWNYKSGGPNGQLCGDPLGAGIAAARVTSSWTTSGLSWYNQPSISSTMEGGNKAGYNYEAAAGSWCAKEEQLVHRVTGMARAWIEQGAPNHGLVLRAATETASINWRQYYSSEYSGDPYPGYRHPPALVVEYVPAVAEYVSMWMGSSRPLNRMPSYEEAVADQIPGYSGIPQLPGRTAEEVNAASGSDDPYDVDREALQPLPGEDPEVEAEVPWPATSPTATPEPDSTPPAVKAVTPAANATGVPVDARMSAQFTEAVTGAELTLADPSGTAVPGDQALDPGNGFVVFSPQQSLRGDTVYTATVRGAKDSAGNPMAAPHSWSFTTGPPDTDAPAVTGVEPGRDATNVPPSAAVKVTFNEPVSDVQIAVKDPSDTTVEGALTSDNGNAQWILAPASPLAASKVYRVEVSGGKDASGNPMAPYTWSFTTAAEPPPPVPGLVAAYGMNEGSGASVTDSSGQDNTGTGSGTAWTDGKYGKALTFDGSAAWVTVPDAAPLRLTTGMTLSAWVNPVTVTGWSSLITKELAAGASYSLYAGNGDSVPSGWVQTGPEDPSTVSGTSPLPVNAWSHLALTYDGTTLRLFLNGQQAAETPLSGGLHDDGGALRIGGNSVWGEYFRGLIDEVRIYDRAQTAAQIRTDMNTPIGATTPPTATPTATPTPGPTGNPTPVPGLVAAYGMQEGTGTTVGDSSGRNNTGAARDTTWATGRFGTALSFNGTSSRVTVPDAAALRLTNAMTLSAWVQPTALGESWRTVMMKEHAAGGSYGLYASNGAVPAAWLLNAGGPGGAEGTAPLPLRQWSHLAVTYDGGTSRLYVNGTEVGQEAVTGPLVTDDGVLRIGGNDYWGEYFSGLIDEVRIYNRAQSAPEIQTDMNTPISAAGAAVASSAARSTGTTATAAGIAKLTVRNGRTAGGVTVASTATPQLTAWLAGRRDGAAKVQVEVIRENVARGRSAKVARAAGSDPPVWSSETIAEPGDSQVTLQVAKGRLRNGEKVRWRARVAGSGNSGAWTDWQSLAVQQSAGAGTSAAAPLAATAQFPYGYPDLQSGHPTAEWCENEQFRIVSNRPEGAVGYVRPYFYCYSQWLVLPVFKETTDRAGKKTRVGVGAFQFSATTVMHTYVGDGAGVNAIPDHYGTPAGGTGPRDMKAWIKISQPLWLDTAGNVMTTPPQTSIKATIKAAPEPGHTAAECQEINPRSEAQRTRSMASWQSDKYEEFLFRSGGGLGPDKTATCSLRPWIQVTSSLATVPIDTVPLFQPEITPDVYCDTSPAIVRYKGGCRLKYARMIYQMKRTDPLIGQVALHVWQAFYQPETTRPRADNKIVPGNADFLPGRLQEPRDPRAKALHRAARYKDLPAGWSDIPTKNGKRKDTLCLTEWSAAERSGKQCDEYPFATTHEGAYSAGTNVSVKPIDRLHNRDAGNDLNFFYERFRILDGDRFWVRIK
ncbi:hypothetical protein Sru01_63640 [Sphaerisporangium rufum]|uniref:LamG-like jellyroll fold domain-containing protein n=1 Tax=Sphaerisporangium rufum TaxID=1381558 RepID=A0A919RCC3_9ACTN|nr:LamG-like jellyroll fold domain-containing protein [Sphaerisporangium rufum]GII81382.1 hypothetical protein Sru01_63640 [Sphaerisporangium rufum]